MSIRLGVFIGDRGDVLTFLDRKEDETMPNYVILMKLTDQGAKTIKEAPGRVDAGIKTFEKMGGKVIGFYAVMGEYDYVAVGEAPSDEIATTFALGLGSLGNVKTTTLRAFTKEEFAAMLKKLP
jgi:uncharacterized protein with GYD domain